MLDAPSFERIAPVAPEAPILIDHHESDDLSEIASAALVDTDADATSFLVAQLALENDWQLSPDSAFPLLVGIFADTGNLTNATAGTVRLSGILLNKLEHRAEEFSDQISRTPDSSRQNARTLGTLRANGFRAGNLFVAFSKVGAHESAAANALRRNGVDLVLVFSEQSDGYRITGRASDSFTPQVRLGDSLLPVVADEFGGDGGGHAGAGVATVHSGTPEMIEQFILQYLEQQLGITFSPVSGY